MPKPQVFLPPELADRYQRQERLFVNVQNLKRHHEKSKRFRQGNRTKHFRLKKIAELAGVAVWLVDGEAIRRDLYVDFTMGGHGYCYLFIPPNEIWIDAVYEGTGDLWPTIWHEYFERTLMMQGIPYIRAHTQACRLEIVHRGGKTFILPVGTYRQGEDSYCGPACLKIVAEYLGKRVSEKYLAKLCKTTKGGTDPSELAAAARKIGLKARIRRNLSEKDVRDLLQRGIAPIANFQLGPEVGEGHYAVVIGYDEENFILSDPNDDAGYRKVNIAEFMKTWYEIEDRAVRQAILVTR